MRKTVHRFRGDGCCWGVLAKSAKSVASADTHVVVNLSVGINACTHAWQHFLTIEKDWSIWYWHTCIFVLTSASMHIDFGTYAYMFWPMNRCTHVKTKIQTQQQPTAATATTQHEDGQPWVVRLVDRSFVLTYICLSFMWIHVHALIHVCADA